MKTTCECLVDIKTGLPLVVEIPEDSPIDDFRRNAFESGQKII